MLYWEFLKTGYWRELSRSILEQSDYICGWCHGDADQVHHTSYKKPNRSDAPDWVPEGWAPDDALVPLCTRCHKLAHSDMGLKDPKWDKIERHLREKKYWG